MKVRLSIILLLVASLSCVSCGGGGGLGGLGGYSFIEWSGSENGSVVNRRGLLTGESWGREWLSDRSRMS